MNEPRIGTVVRLKAPQTNGRYVGWGRYLYVMVANYLAISTSPSEEMEPKYNLPLPSDGETFAVYGAGGRITKSIAEQRRRYLSRYGLGEL